MAGFQDKPFYLARNSILPPLELQRSIFPWIEDYFGSDNYEWKKTCEKEMHEYDENEDDESDIEEEILEFVEEDGQIIEKRRKPSAKKVASVERSVDTAKRGFLRLLVRCRRVILQDAAVFLHLGKENAFVNTKARSENPFTSSSFKDFQEHVADAVSAPSIDRLQEFEGLVPNIVDSQKVVSNRIAELNIRMAREQLQSNNRFSRIEDMFLQQQQSNSRMESMLAALNEQLQRIERNQQVLSMSQQCLSSHIQLSMATDINSALATASPFSTPAFQHQDQVRNTTITSPTLLPVAAQPILPVFLPRPTPSIILPHSANNSSNAIPRSSSLKGKKKAKWVSYNP